MKFLLIFTLCLSQSVFSMGSRRPKPVPEIPIPPIETPVPTAPANSEGFQVDFKPAKNFATSVESDLIAKASLKLNETVKSACFAAFMTAATLKQTQGRNNLQVLTHLLSFRETVSVKMYYRKWGCKIGCTSAIAYRQPPEKSINLNSSYFTAKRKPCVWAATMAHESLGHSLGNYDHSSDWNVAREYSVPYKIGGASENYGGNAMETCCKD